MSWWRRTAPGPSCASCRQFEGGSRALEAALPGLVSLSSASASVRADDGLCAQHGRFTSGRAWCASYAPVLGRIGNHPER